MNKKGSDKLLEIEVFSGVEAIRRRPHLYFGELSRENLYRLFTI